MIPTRPQCFSQDGALQCPCANTLKRHECRASRQFWECARTIAGSKDDRSRRGILAPIAQSRGTAFAQEMRQAAWALIQEAKQGDLLAAAA